MQLHRIFCATPWEMERERGRFHEIVGQFNETYALPQSILYVPVSLANIRDKRPLQYAIDENIEDCRYFVLLLDENWGPVERNFENDYHLALKCIADSSRPMCDLKVLRRIPPSERPLAAGMPEPHASFATMPEFEQCLNTLLRDWFASLTGENAAQQSPPPEHHATA